MFPPPYDLDSKIQLGVEETLIFDEKMHISDSNASEEIKNALDDVEYLDSYKDHAESSIDQSNFTQMRTELFQKTLQHRKIFYTCIG